MGQGHPGQGYPGQGHPGQGQGYTDYDQPVADNPLDYVNARAAPPHYNVKKQQPKQRKAEPTSPSSPQYGHAWD
jgi:hypothetical protein